MHMIRIHQNLEFKGNRATPDKSNMTTGRKNTIVHRVTFIDILTTFYNRIIRQNKIKRIKLNRINHCLLEFSYCSIFLANSKTELTCL